MVDDDGSVAHTRGADRKGGSIFARICFRQGREYQHDGGMVHVRLQWFVRSLRERPSFGTV